MQIVDPRPGQVAATHLIHRRGISGAPAVGEGSPILLDPMASTELLQLADDAGAPIDDGAEHVEGERCRCHHGSRTTFPSTPPSARLCNASAPFDSGNRTGGGGRSPALTNSATPNSNTAWEPGMRLTYSPYPTPMTATVRSSSRLTLTVGIPPAAK